MKFFLKLGLILLAFAAVATALLAYVNSVTKPRIDAFKVKAAETARATLIPGAAFTPYTVKTGTDSLVYYAATDSSSQALRGYVFTAAKYGYSSNVKTMAAVDTAYKIIAIQVIEQAETPGLGANCQKEDFPARFAGLAEAELTVDKDGGKIKALTGATITTRAVANSLKETLALVRRDIESRQAQPATPEVLP